MSGKSPLTEPKPGEKAGPRSGATAASRRPKSAASTLTRVFDPSARPKIKEVRFVENPSVLDE